MAMRVIRKLSVAQENGEKTYWLNVGILLYDDEKKKFSIKLNALPIGAAWDGWIGCFELDDKEDGDKPKRRQRDDDDEAPKRRPVRTSPDSFDDDIPF